MNRRLPKRLSLTIETVRALDRGRLDRIAGATNSGITFPCTIGCTIGCTVTRGDVCSEACSRDTACVYKTCHC